MAENTDEEHMPEIPEGQQENTTATPAASTDNNTTNITPPEQDTATMEVHHHRHAGHGKKTWKDYFWEFLMLFLAVFCGFMAEYLLEHKLEKDRAEELAKSFYYELKNDSATAVIKVQNRIKQENALNDIIRYFKDSSLTNVPKSFTINFEYGINFRTPAIFEPKTTILEQLKNSGALRYFKNEELQRLIGDITVAIKNIYDRQDLETQNRLQYINPIILQLYDYDFDAHLKDGGKTVFEGIKQYEESSEFFPFHIDDPEKFNRHDAIKVLSFYKANVMNSTRVTIIKKYTDTNAELLALLRKEYHLE